MGSRPRWELCFWNSWTDRLLVRISAVLSLVLVYLSFVTSFLTHSWMECSLMLRCFDSLCGFLLAAVASTAVELQ